MPPFLFDVGIEFVDPPASLRQSIVQKGSELASEKGETVQEKTLASSMIHGREYLPRLERASRPHTPWHLVVLVGGVPCFSGHYPSERAALAAWAQFKREQAKR